MIPILMEVLVPEGGRGILAITQAAARSSEEKDAPVALLPENSP